MARLQRQNAPANPRDRSVLFVIGSLDIGGAENHIVRITPRIAKRGWTPVVYCIGRRGFQAKALSDAGVEVIGPPAEGLLSSHHRAIKAVALGLSGIKLLGIYLARRPGITHFFLPQAYLLGGALSLLARVPLRIMSRRSLNEYRHNHPRAWALERRLHRHMTAILGNSRIVVRQLVEEEGCDPARTGLIYNGIDLTKFAPAADRTAMRNRLGLDEDALVMLIVANLIPYKGHADLLDALAGIRKKLPTGWMLLCAGRDDGSGAALRERAETLGIGDHVRFLGLRADVPDLYAAADIGLLCSHEEGFSNAILEGMASSLPMIVTDVGGNAEAIIHGTTGLVVPPRDPKVLGTAIMSLVRLSVGSRREMGAQARRRAEECFSLEACVDAYDQLYRLLGAGQNVGGLTLDSGHARSSVSR